MPVNERQVQDVFGTRILLITHYFVPLAPSRHML